MRGARTVATRLLAPLARRATAGSARVLMYHRFAPAGDFRRLGAEVFDRQVRYLRRHFATCRFDDLVRRLREGGVSGRPTATITVDDGYLDFYEVAYPILQRYGVPATVFVVSRFADQAMWLWFDALHYLVHAARPGRYRLDGGRAPIDLDLGPPAGREAAWHAVADACWPLFPDGRAAFIRALELLLDLELPARPPDRYRAMTWDELKGLDAGLIEIGAHTCTHPVLSRLPASELEVELTHCKVAIEHHLGLPVRSFCYPFGRAEDYSPAVTAAVARAGYEGAVVAHGTLVTPGDQLLTLARSSAPFELDRFREVVDGVVHLSGLARARWATMSGVH